MLGAKPMFAQECFEGNFIGGDWNMRFDLTGKFPDDRRAFNKTYNPVYMARNPGKSKVTASLGNGMLYTICKGINIGDIILCPTGEGAYHVGEVTSEYYYVPDVDLPHRRTVQWYLKTIDRAEMSEGLKTQPARSGPSATSPSMRTRSRVCSRATRRRNWISTDELVEDPSVFAMEMHLEDFLVQNWAHTALGHDYDIVEDEGELVGKQYPTDTGPIDILAVAKDKSHFWWSSSSAGGRAMRSSARSSATWVMSRKT